MVHPHGPVILVESRLVVRQEVDAQEHRPQLAKVGHVALHVLLGSVAGGVDPLQLPAAVEVVVGVDDVGHLDVGAAHDGDGRIGDSRLRHPQGVVVDAELHPLGLEVLGPPGPVVLPVVGLADDVAVARDLLGVVDPPVGTDHGVAVVAKRFRHPVNVGLPDRLGDDGVQHVLVVVGAPVEGPGPPGRNPGTAEGACSKAARADSDAPAGVAAPSDISTDRRPRQAGQDRASATLEQLASRRHPITPPSQPLGATPYSNRPAAGLQIDASDSACRHGEAIRRAVGRPQLTDDPHRKVQRGAGYGSTRCRVTGIAPRHKGNADGRGANGGGPELSREARPGRMARDEGHDTRVRDVGRTRPRAIRSFVAAAQHNERADRRADRCRLTTRCGRHRDCAARAAGPGDARACGARRLQGRLGQMLRPGGRRRARTHRLRCAVRGDACGHQDQHQGQARFPHRTTMTQVVSFRLGPFRNKGAASTAAAARASRL